MLTIDFSKDRAGDRFDLEVQRRKISKLSESFPGQVSLSEDVSSGTTEGLRIPALATGTPSYC